MNTPTLHIADELKNWDCQAGIQREDGSTFWCLARPMGFKGVCLRQRIKLAWMVFTGKADALKWHEA